jgi:predicted MFS family arabinose efflux permease
MRWLILLPAAPGALMGGWLGEHVGLRAALVFAGALALVSALAATRVALLMRMRQLPTAADAEPAAKPNPEEAEVAREPQPTASVTIDLNVKV